MQKVSKKQKSCQILRLYWSYAQTSLRAINWTRIGENEADLEEIISNLVKIGDELGKLVVATGNVHYLNEEDAIYRKILVGSMGGANPLNRHSLPKVHFRTTDEMLTEFQF